MNLYKLKCSDGTLKKKKRIGRGQGSGKGGTAAKGHNGAQSRSGYKKKKYFEAGQMPLQRRVPKFGFKNPNQKYYKPINIDTLQYLIKKENIQCIDPGILKKYGLVKKNEKYKILGKGLLKTKVNINAHAFSISAFKAIKEVQGEAVTL